MVTAALDRPVTLSARERECLYWIAQGKTSWETGVIVGISERTVNFHLRNTRVKLGVHNRSAAVARSMQLGLLDGLTHRAAGDAKRNRAGH